MVFSPLTEEQIHSIIDLSLKSLSARLADRNVTLHLTDAAKSYIAGEAYDPLYGARPVKRYLQKYVETALAEMLIRGDCKDGDLVTADASENGLTFRTEEVVSL